MTTLADVIRLCYTKFKENKLSWTYNHNDNMWVRVKGNIIDVDWSGHDPVGLIINLRNSNGVAIASQAILAREDEGRMLLEMAKEVKRKALGIDDILNEVAEDLLKR